jgi:hypothetical protein
MGSRFVRDLRLERFSAAFAKVLLARHPEWQACFGAYEEEEDGFRQRYLEVRVPSEHPRVTEPLVIRTRPEEVYLDWAGWHDHVFPWPDQSEDALFADALAKIDLWMSDEYLFATIYRDGARVREWGCSVGREDPDDLQVGRGERVVIRSWRGTHDEERLETA